MLTESCKKFLTEEVLKGYWHEVRDGVCSCGKLNRYGIAHHTNPTFTTIQDLHALYSAVERDGRSRWYLLCETLVDFYLMTVPEDERVHAYPIGPSDSFAFMAWLFCLNGTPEDFEARAKMVAEFYEWRRIVYHETLQSSKYSGSR